MSGIVLVLIAINSHKFDASMYVCLNSHNYYLTGTLPPEIGNLQNLVGFGCERNQIGGSLNILVNMSSLQELTLRRNNFTGNLSRDIGNLTMLTKFDIGENYMTGKKRRPYDIHDTHIIVSIH